MKKIKLLILALLGLILIPTTNAYELSTLEVDSSYDDYNSSTFIRYDGACLNLYDSVPGIWLNGGGRWDYGVEKPEDCGEGRLKGSFYANEQIGYYKDTHSMLFYPSSDYNDRLVYLAVSRDGEGLNIFRTSLSDNKQSIHTLSLPSRTAYKYTTSHKKDFMLTNLIAYHNTFMLYDPTTRFGVSFLGKMKIENGMVLANPALTQDNFMFINFQAKKAYSATITKTAAAKWRYGSEVSLARLQSVNFDKSYTMEEGGNSFLPQTFFNSNQLETTGWIYQEDIEFISPDWHGGKPNNGTGNQVAQNYRACVARRSDIKVLAQISKSCGDDPLDSETLNWVKVDSWNGDGDAKSIIDKLEGGNKIKCGRFANIKKKFYDRYSKEWSSWYKDFTNYAFTPEAIDVQAQCRGEELEQEHGSAGVSPFSASGMELLANSLGQIGSTLLNSLDCGDGKRISQALFEKRFGTYIAYYTACRDKSFMPTKYDSWKSYIVGYDYFFGGNNNENVCRYALELKESLMKKYGNCVFGNDYRASVSSDLSGNVFGSDGKLDGNALENVASGLPGNPFDDPDLGLSKIVEYFSKDYKLGNDKAFDFLGYKNCGKGLGIKDWDYLVYLFLILFLFIIFRGRL